MTPHRLVAALGDAYKAPREYAKLGLRSILYRRRLDLVADPYPVRIATTLRWLDADTVLDIGANIGQFGSALRASGYRGSLISCEPLGGAFAQLARRASADPAWAVERTAVGASVGTTQINVSENSFSSSLLPMTRTHREAQPDSGYIGTEDVDVSTVVELAKRYRIDPARTLLKIDTQGYEGEVLNGAGELIGELAAVSLEMSFVTLYEGQQFFDDLLDRLRAAGYQLHALNPGLGDPHTGRMLQCDGLFVHRKYAD
jgi:FkbM family methyltransferase